MNTIPLMIEQIDGLQNWCIYAKQYVSSGKKSDLKLASESLLSKFKVVDKEYQRLRAEIRSLPAGESETAWKSFYNDSNQGWQDFEKLLNKNWIKVHSVKYLNAASHILGLAQQFKFQRINSSAAHYQTQAEELSPTFDQLSDTGRNQTRGSSSSSVSALIQQVKLFWDDVPENRYRLSLPERHPDTYKWFPVLRDYTSWYDCSTLSLLYIKASPGTGKSVLTSFLIDDNIEQRYRRRTNYSSFEPDLPREILQLQEKLIAISFFFREEEANRQSADGMLRCLISQLLQKVPTLIKHTLLHHIEVANKEASLPSSWAFDTLWNVFFNMISDPDVHAVPVFIYIDGLNECDEKSRSLFLKRLRTDIKDRHVEFDDLHLLLTGRPHPDIDLATEQMAFRIVSLDQFRKKQLSEDIKLVIEYEMELLSVKTGLRQNPDGQKLINTIKKHLLDGHDGLFLWTMFNIRQFDGYGLSEAFVEEKIASSPKGLFELYSKVMAKRMAKLKNSQKADLQRSLECLLAAARPLTELELQVSWAIRETREDLKVMEAHRNLNMKALVKALLPDFVAISKDNAFTFTHNFVREFFIEKNTASNSDILEYTVKLQDANTAMAISCLHFLTLPEVQEKGKKDMWTKWDCICFGSNVVGNRSCQHPPFFGYAALFWSQHLKKVESPALEFIQEIHRLLSKLPPHVFLVDHRQAVRKQNSTNERQFHHERGAPGESTPIHTAAYFDIFWLVKYLLDRRFAGPNDKTDVGGTPIVFASERGNLDIVQLLVSKGGDVNITEDDGWTALHWAYANRHADVQDYLIDKGAFSQLDKDGHPPEYYPRTGGGITARGNGSAHTSGPQIRGDSVSSLMLRTNEVIQEHSNE